MDSIFQEANELYKKEKYEEAIENYLKIFDAGYESSELYYNTGNAYFRSNKLGKARLFYERALLLDPSDKEIQKNLSYTTSLLTDKFDVVPELFYKRWAKTIKNSMSSNGWLILSLLFFGLFLLSSGAYIFISAVKLKKLGFYGGLLFFVLTLGTFMLSSAQYKHYSEPGHAIIMKPSLVVKSAPRDSGKDLFILHEGSKVKMGPMVEDWVEIRITDGRTGWVRIASLEEI